MLAEKVAVLFGETDVRLWRHLLGAFSECSSLAHNTGISIRTTRRTVLTINRCFPCLMYLRRHWRRYFKHRLVRSSMCVIAWGVSMSGVGQVLQTIGELASHGWWGDGVRAVAVLLMGALHLQFFHFLGCLLVLHLEILLKSFEAFRVE